VFKKLKWCFCYFFVVCVFRRKNFIVNASYIISKKKTIPIKSHQPDCFYLRLNYCLSWCWCWCWCYYGVSVDVGVGVGDVVVIGVVVCVVGSNGDVIVKRGIIFHYLLLVSEQDPPDRICMTGPSKWIFGCFVTRAL
jgi:hypothetical protein